MGALEWPNGPTLWRATRPKSAKCWLERADVCLWSVQSVQSVHTDRQTDSPHSGAHLARGLHLIDYAKCPCGMRAAR